jgi:TPR repeat protein
MQTEPELERLLSRLVLYRNDPACIDDLRTFAIAGYRDAQYALGLAYAEGRGEVQDLVAAYKWLSLAIEQGDEDARTLRYVVMQQMSAEQLARAERRPGPRIGHNGDVQ